MSLVAKTPTLQDSELAGTGLDWISTYIQNFDLGKITRFVVRSGEKRKSAKPGVWGMCSNSAKGWKLTCTIKGPFPATIRIRKSDVYPKKVSYGKKRLFNEQEAVVWIVAHEFFHYLYWTEQINGNGSEIEADAFANARLDEYRKWSEEMDYGYSCLERMEVRT